MTGNAAAGFALRAALALLACATPSLALDGVVTNRTTGKPAANVPVTLTRIATGMEVVGRTTSDADGRFSIAHTLQGPYLLQASYQGVNYNRQIPPGTKPEGLEILVFDSTAQQPDETQVTQHMVVLEPSESEILVSESITVQNGSQRTWNDPAGGTLRFFVPANVKGDVAVQATGPQGMPLPRPAEKTREPNVYAVAFAVKPGETQFDVRYTVPKEASGTFSGKLLHTTGRTFLVAPAGVTLSGEAIQPNGTEPRTQANVYALKGQEYSLTVQGTGTLQPPQGGEESSGPEIETVKPKIYDRWQVILGLSFGILMIGFVLLYRAGMRQPVAASGRGKRGG